MGGKDKKKEEVQVDEEEDDSGDESFDPEQEIDVVEQVQQKIKALPTLREKVQAIAVNGYLIEKRRLDQEMQHEIEAIERRFRETYNPHIDQINSIISGKHTFSDADFQEIGELLTEQELETKHNYFSNEKIPEYWLKVLLHSEVIGEQVEERDEPLLRHLQKVEAGKSEDLKRLWVTFYFSENEWFTNEKLHKEFELSGEEIKKSFGDQIKWKAGKNITVTIVKKKKKKGAEKKTKEVKQKSFFNFFLDVEIVQDDKEENDDEDNEEVEQLESQYETAQELYENIVPKSLEYFLGLIETMDDLGEFDGEDEEDEEQEQVKPKKLKAK